MKRSIRLIQTSDLHGYIFSKSYADLSKTETGVSSLSNQIKKYRTKGSILVDTGDTIQGSALTYYHEMHKHSEQSPMASALNYLGYDYIGIGNHDFNYGIDYLMNYTKTLQAKVLSNNVLKDNQLMFEPYHIHITEDGIKIGIIGTVTQHIPFWENPDNIKDMTFIDAYEAIKQTVNEIKDQVDSIIVIYHGGFEIDPKTLVRNPSETGENEGFKILSEIKDIDVLLTGHQHQILADDYEGTLYTQPGANGSHFGLIDLEFEKKDNRWTLVDKKCELIKNTHQPDEVIDETFHDLENEVQSWLDEVIGQLDESLPITDPLQCRINKHKIVSFINQVQMDASGVDISCTSLGNEVKGFDQTITMRDIISTYIYPNTLVVLEMTGKLFKQFIEKNATFFTKDGLIAEDFLVPKKELYNYDMFDGIQYTIDLREEVGSRVKDITYHGEAISDDVKYQVVMNNYRAAGGGGFELLKDATIAKTIEVDIVELLANYIRKHQSVVINHEDNIKIIK